MVCPEVLIPGLRCARPSCQVLANIPERALFRWSQGSSVFQMIRRRPKKSPAGMRRRGRQEMLTSDPGSKWPRLPADPVRSPPFRSYPVICLPIRSDPLPSRPLPSIPFRSSACHSPPFRSGTLRSAPIRCLPIRSGPVHSAPLLCLPLPSAPFPSDPCRSRPLHCLPFPSLPVRSCPLHYFFNLFAARNSGASSATFRRCSHRFSQLRTSWRACAIRFSVASLLLSTFGIDS